MASRPPDSDPRNAVYKDPFTGTTPTGPVQPAPPGEDVGREEPARWSFAAKWLLGALLFLLLAFAIGLYYW